MEEKIMKIRPAGRHLLTIGRDLIKDDYAAIAELVKNAYDADAQNVIIHIKSLGEAIQISIKDDGHGMNYETIANKWLVPSTNDKQIRRESPGKRIMQGKKGIGRYAAAILGDELLLNTVSEGYKTSILLNWNDFENATYLSDVDILLERTEDHSLPYTEIIITGDALKLSEWKKIGKNNIPEKITTLKKELRKLISPKFKDREDTFNIKLTFEGLYENQESPETVQIEPLPLMDLFDYRISGIFKNGVLDLLYENHKFISKYEEETWQDNSYEQFKELGLVEFDVRAYDRETKDIENLISKGLKEDNQYLGINETRNLLNEVNGIGVYRNNFRIRPLGDADFDWLQLNKKRVQNPSFSIGSDQVIGFISIENEDRSGLQEKSARDGLKENGAYHKLVSLSSYVINQLEKKRYIFRQSKNTKKKTTIKDDVARLYNNDDIKKDIIDSLDKNKVDNDIKNNVIKIIENDEINKQKAALDIEQKIAVYQGQATLGKIINVILHESRRPLNFFVEQEDNIEYWSNKLKKGYNEKALNEILNILSRFPQNIRTINSLFSKLDPLAFGKKGYKKNENLLSIIKDSVSFFEQELEKHSISIKLNCNPSFTIDCYRSDIIAVFLNLIENSIYWLDLKQSDDKKIEINVLQDNQYINVDYYNNGEVLKEDLISSGIIFDPEYSGKNGGGGTGLGLAIAGEACHRNNINLEALYTPDGALFRLSWETCK